MPTRPELEEACKSCASIEAADKLLAGFGVEYAAVADRELAYVNTGESYADTVCQEDNGPLFVSSLGAWVEATEDEHCKDTDSIRCAYCGAFTPLCAAALAEPVGERYSWADTVCESCGHNVDG